MLNLAKGMSPEELIFNFTQKELYSMAQELKIKGRSKMDKTVLALNIEKVINVEYVEEIQKPQQFTLDNGDIIEIGKIYNFIKYNGQTSGKVACLTPWYNGCNGMLEQELISGSGETKKSYCQIELSHCSAAIEIK